MSTSTSTPVSTSTSTPVSMSTSRRLRWLGSALGSSALRLLLGCGLAGPVLFIGTFLIEGATRPGYDAWRQAVSALGLGPGGGVQRADFIVFGLLIGLFALGLRAALARGAAAFWAPLLQGVIALGLLLDGLVPSGRLHLLGDSLTFTAFPLCAFVLAARFVRVPRWRGWAAYSVVSGLLFWAALIAFQVTTAHTGPAGLFERAAVLVSALWTIVLAARLAARTGRVAPPR
jgi:hypothetical membrane protein